MLCSKLLLNVARVAPLPSGLVDAVSLKRNSPQQIVVNNNFETDMNDDPTASTQEINVYNLLYWTMTLATLGVDGVFAAGVIPHTPSNVAAFTARSMQLNGPAMISANYDTSQIQSFTLSSAYYSCAPATAETATAPPTSCTITATAYNKDNIKLTTQSFSYVASGAAAQQQNPVTFGWGIQNVYFVNFTLTNPTTTAAQLDNVVVTLFE